jgi:hypothetical protein
MYERPPRTTLTTDKPSAAKRPASQHEHGRDQLTGRAHDGGNIEGTTAEPVLVGEQNHGGAQSRSLVSPTGKNTCAI